VPLYKNGVLWAASASAAMEWTRMILFPRQERMVTHQRRRFVRTSLCPWCAFAISEVPAQSESLMIASLCRLCVLCVSVVEHRLGLSRQRHPEVTTGVQRKTGPLLPALLSLIFILSFAFALLLPAQTQSARGVIRLRVKLKVGETQKSLARKRFFLIKGSLEDNKALLDHIAQQPVISRDCFYRGCTQVTRCCAG